MLPKTMIFIRTERFGPPEVLLPAEMDVPAPGKGEVLIKVAAAGVNRPDVIQRTGHYPPPPGASDVLGLEVAGIVVGTGEGVTEPALGEQVCALVISGGYAEYCVAPAALCLPVPAPLSLIEAAGLPETCFTVWTNVFERGRLQAGESFLVHGGTSGIGTTAIPLAKAFGARCFATAGSAEKCQVCRDLGAEIAINHRSEDFVAVVKAATGRRGVDVILDMVGGDYIQRNISALAPDGRLVQIAFLKGSKAELDLMPVMLKRLTVTGSTLRARPVAEKASIAAALKAKVWPLLEAGQLKPVIHTTLPLAQAAEAHRLMESNRHIGKIILTV
ncbi:NAD(P)H-quinone oxidoreductase [Candidatus Defluviicoccus seviourii]|uniref:NAD(P)H-quinone oxidoreductase n=1 Tax=Candidatus Defluviicoccus seviourii TaxID=2565273 RepID=A0A564WJ49_9PROT|nr:NAD(P)H-quinone oxidoreductase [Candidatus Defluviicoccus seviourii]